MLLMQNSVQRRQVCGMWI